VSLVVFASEFLLCQNIFNLTVQKSFSYFTEDFIYFSIMKCKFWIICGFLNNISAGFPVVLLDRFSAGTFVFHTFSCNSHV